MNKANNLYKFRNWDDQYHRRLLTHNELYFSSCDKFNDPFDGMIPIRYDTISDSKLKEIISEHLDLEDPSITRQMKRLETRKVLKRKAYHNIEDQIRWQNEYRSREFGICSFAGNCSNIVMWSHYANSHLGFCVTFQIPSIESFIDGTFSQSKIIIELDKVNYQTDFPNFDAYDLRHSDDFIRLPLITKSSDWAYENEYRLISLNKNNIAISFQDNLIESIILGCRISPKHEEEILSVIRGKNNGIKVLKAKTQSLSFGLEFIPVSY